MVAKKPEDTADGCRALAQADRARAAEAANGHMRGTLEPSAESWAARADLLAGLQANFSARAEAYSHDHDDRRAGRKSHG
ncbi:hypothetical protein [Sphingomonas sp. URHD0057]|uniref:hypothetical protein n=1 Tax=Sphingomonas sp. URHD0057 TaxID=1380389 RepID=UPI00048C3894|nr:hypothetical protein [Sphingomonas sp. URHD0057]